MEEPRAQYSGIDRPWPACCEFVSSHTGTHAPMRTHTLLKQTNHSGLCNTIDCWALADNEIVLDAASVTTLATILWIAVNKMQRVGLLLI